MEHTDYNTPEENRKRIGTSIGNGEEGAGKDPKKPGNCATGK